VFVTFKMVLFYCSSVHIGDVGRRGEAGGDVVGSGGRDVGRLEQCGKEVCRPRRYGNRGLKKRPVGSVTGEDESCDRRQCGGDKGRAALLPGQGRNG
jgi:hypothetical protein